MDAKSESSAVTGGNEQMDLLIACRLPRGIAGEVARQVNRPDLKTLDRLLADIEATEEPERWDGLA